MVKKALLIGIEYKKTNIELKGTKNDVKLIKNMLIREHGFEEKNIVELLESPLCINPTADNIISQLKHHVDTLTSDDFFVFQYSGHGQYMIDTNGDELDGFDEAIVPLDYKEKGVIIDDLINSILSNIKCRTFILFDTCYSGTMCDLPYTWDIDNGYKCITNPNKVMNNTNIIKLASSLDREESFTIMSERQTYIGAFTNAFYLTMKTQCNCNVNFDMLIKNINTRIKQKSLKQHCVLESSSKLANLTTVHNFLQKINHCKPVNKFTIEKQDRVIEDLRNQINTLKSANNNLLTENEMLNIKKNSLLKENNDLKLKLTNIEDTLKRSSNGGLIQLNKTNIRYMKQNKKSYILSMQK